MISQPVTSSNIARAGWEHGNLYLELNSGQCYQYAGVTQKEYEELISSESVGQHFHRNIKAKFYFKKLQGNPMHSLGNQPPDATSH